MTYAIAKVIYGLPNSEYFETSVKNIDIASIDKEWISDNNIVDGNDLLEFLFESGDFFDTAYTGRGYVQAGWIGFELGSFDECGENVKLSSLMFTPNESQKAIAEERINKLPQQVRDLLPPDIDVYVVWSTS